MPSWQSSSHMRLLTMDLDWEDALGFLLEYFLMEYRKQQSKPAPSMAHHNLLCSPEVTLWEGNISNSNQFFYFFLFNKYTNCVRCGYLLWLSFSPKIQYTNQNHSAMTLLFCFSMLSTEGQMTEPKQTSRLQISMRIQTELTLDFLYQVCEIHQQVPVRTNLKMKYATRNAKSEALNWA